MENRNAIITDNRNPHSLSMIISARIHIFLFEFVDFSQLRILLIFYVNFIQICEKVKL